MFWQIVKFEILYRLKRPATYIYFFLFLVIAFVFVSAPGMSFAESGDKLNANAPLLMSQLITALMMFGSIVCAAIMGVPVFRDYDYNFYEIIHSLPVRKMDYLWGRFFGSFLISLLIFSSIIFGMMLGYSMPWLEDDTLGPFVLASFINPFLFFVLPNTFILGTLFFISGSFFRSQAAIYAQGVVFLVLYIGSSMLLANVEQNAALSLFDPFGMEAVSEMTKYWTTAEKNILQVYPEGWILYNRIIWIALAAGASILFTWRFNPAKNYSFASGRSRRKNITISNSQPVADIKVSRQTSGWKTGFLQWWHLTVFYFKGIVTSIPFLIMICCAIGLIAIARIGEGMMYGTKSFPVTYMLLDSITGNFMLFMIIIVIVYSGEVLWKDINTRFSLILDSSPISSVRILLSKFNAMVMAELVLLVTIILTGMVIQVTAGFYDFQLGVYIKFLVLNTFPFIFFITFITFLVHTLVNNKFLGHGIVILFYLSRAFYDNIGLNHILFKYGNSPTESYSGMNGLQKFSGPAFTIDFHWLLLSVVLLIITIFFIKRGSELGIRTRSRLFLLNWKQSRLRYAVIGGLVLFILSGFNIYYNINVLNTYMTKKEYRHFRAEYEKKYSLYKNYPQPRITDVNLNVDIFPDEYAFTANGAYILVNKSGRVLDTLHLRLDPDVKIKAMDFSRPLIPIDTSYAYGYYIYSIEDPLQPGDTMTCDFNIEYREEGFENWGRPTQIVPNGTFFTNQFLPYFGYDDSFVITKKKDRKKEGLEEKEFESPELTDSSAYINTYISPNADRIRYEAIVSTNADQTALTCGKLVKDWEENGRHYFHYRMEEPVWNFYPFLSARYAVRKDSLENVGLEIYYHPGHEYNLDKMLAAAKKTILYCDSSFYPYQHSVLRIVEFPRYSMYAQSFAGIIPFSEGVGFILDVDEKLDIDVPFYITSHEVAHQWWGHHVCAADVKGKLMLVESLANYTALMVMEHETGKKNIGKFLKYEQDRYLMSRSMERKKEVPLDLVDDQQYIAYNKGSIALYALRDYIGETSLNAALRDFVRFYSYHEAPYPTSVDLIAYIEKSVPDSLNYLVNDLFRTITLFGNRIDSCHYSILENGKYEVSFSATTEKFRADSLGNQEQVTPADWIDIGVFAEGSDGKDSLIYIRQVRVDTNQVNCQVILDIKPTKVGIDPLNLLIDRNLTDNVKTIKEKG